MAPAAIATAAPMSAASATGKPAEPAAVDDAKPSGTTSPAAAALAHTETRASRISPSIIAIATSAASAMRSTHAAVTAPPYGAMRPAAAVARAMPAPPAMARDRSSQRSGRA